MLNLKPKYIPRFRRFTTRSRIGEIRVTQASFMIALMMLNKTKCSNRTRCLVGICRSILERSIILDMAVVPNVQVAIIGAPDGRLVVSSEAAVPQLVGDMILIRTKAISINPVDTKMIGPYVTPGAISGCDFAGEVIAVGPESGTKDVHLGDRVCGAIMGMNPLKPSTGAFATYVGISSSNILRIPPGMSFEEAAAIGTSFMTTGLALFHSLGLPGTPDKPLQSSQKLTPVLISGGPSASGTAAIQLLRLAGYSPIVTSSPKNFDLVKSYGAAAVFDYSSPDCAKEIRSYTKNNLRYALDCVTTVESMKLCYAAIGRTGGAYTGLDPFPEVVAATRKVIRADWVLGPTMLGEVIAWPEPHYRGVDEEIRKFGLQWRGIVEDLFAQGRLRVHPVSVQPNGFHGALDGLERIRKGLVRGVKLVYPIDSSM
ncbi:GroES-like protein [Xylaria sp. FL1042]|nr:GroES-like protein [Xylaria sp. FL1042]